MKKIVSVILVLILFASLSACDNNSKKMKGFTYEELAEFLSSVDSLTELGDTVSTVVDGNLTELGAPLDITCGDDSLTAGLPDWTMNHSGHNPYLSIYMAGVLYVEVDFESATRSSRYDGVAKPNFYSRAVPLDRFFERNIEKKYFRGSPNNIAYIIGNLGFKSSPVWTEWIDYGIRWSYNSADNATHGYFNLYWYNPLSEDFERGAYYTQTEDLTEIYVVFQDMSLFFSPIHTYVPGNYFPERYHSPLLMSETKYNELKAEYPLFKYDHYKRGTVKEFSEWFMGEYLEEIPAVFADIKDEYVYYPAYGEGIHPDDLNGDEYDCDAMFIPDMKDLGVNFDELRSYVIKITIPHDGIFSDIYWELIG